MGINGVTVLWSDGFCLAEQAREGWQPLVLEPEMPLVPSLGSAVY
jgi:hypothetical protein